FAVIDISIRSQQEMIDLSEKIQDLEAKFTFDGLQIEYGGEIFAAFELLDPASVTWAGGQVHGPRSCMVKF
ncbi:MAG: hypothetical protein ACKO2E_09300, partial [Actinomycetota bacterium]